MREIQKIMMAMGALGVSITSIASAVVVAAGSTPSLQAKSAEELARYIAAGGLPVAC